MQTLFALAMIATSASAAHANEATAMPTAADDAYLWLEDIHGAKPLAWVEAENAQTKKAYADTPAFETMRTRILEVLDSDAKIPFVSKIGAHYYNFWKDRQHPRGVWRRTTLEEYRKDQPAWESVIDLDALAKAEGRHWVWHGADCLKPDYRRCLVALSPGGGDAAVIREFDLLAKTFVDDGFKLPEAKSQVAWIDIDHVYVGTDFGPAR